MSPIRCGAVRVVGVVLVLWTAPAAASEKIDLTPRETDLDFAQVDVELEVGGHLLVRAEQTPSAEAEQKAESADRKLPMSVHASISYEEWRVPDTLAQPWLDEDGMETLGMRHYRQADATLKIDDGGVKPQLPVDRRLMLVRLRPGEPVSFTCPAGPLERKDLDLIDVVGNSMALPLLLPSEPIDETASWNQDEAAMTALLGLDSIVVCEVQSIIEKTGQRYIQVRIAGAVHGTIDGAATEIDLQGIYLFDRQSRRITNLNLAVQEKRSPGHATPGLDVVAKLKLNLKPITSSSELGKAELSRLASEDAGFDTTLSYHGRQQGFRFRHGRPWFVTSEDRDAVTLRRIEDGDLVAQCTVTRLPQQSAERPTSIEQFQKDVQFSLRDNFGQFVKTRQWQSPGGLNLMQLVVHGTVDEVPVEWHHFLIATEQGERVSMAVTLEQRMAERLGEDDRDLANTLEIVSPEPSTESTPVAEHSDPQPRVSKAESAPRRYEPRRATPRASRRLGGFRR